MPGTELSTVDGNHVIPYTRPDVVATQIRQAVAKVASKPVRCILAVRRIWVARGNGGIKMCRGMFGDVRTTQETS
jgi:hypothetical protein